jgi:hypothetical protein
MNPKVYCEGVGVHTNVARDQPSLQSTTQFGGSSAKAVDGVRSGFYSVSSVTHNGSPLVCVVGKVLMTVSEILKSRVPCLPGLTLNRGGR